MAHIFAECFWKNTCKDNAIKEDLTLYGIILIVSSMSVHVVFPFFVFKCCIFFWDFKIDICTHNSSGVYKSDALNLILLLKYCFSQPHHGIKSVVILYCSHNLTLHIKCISILFPKHLVLLRNIFLATFCY
jgi:hypothetical protein